MNLFLKSLPILAICLAIGYLYIAKERLETKTQAQFEQIRVLQAHNVHMEEQMQVLSSLSSELSDLQREMNRIELGVQDAEDFQEAPPDIIIDFVNSLRP